MTAGTDYWTTARTVCTPAELETLKLRDIHGLSPARIAFILNLSRRSIRDRLDNADRKIFHALNEPKEPAA